MPTLTPLLSHLALIIDLKQDRLEKTHAPFLRHRLRAELEELFERFQAEYQEFMLGTDEPQKVTILSRAA